MSTTIKKRYASRLRMNTLQEDQLNAFNGIHSFLFNDSRRYAKLNGKAGTGKSYLIGVLTEALLVQNTLSRICICAPTHKAVKVMKDECDYFHERLDFMTIHSLLGVDQQIDSMGQIVFKPNHKGSKVKDFSIIICDEYSMLSSELIDFLDECKSVKVLFVGDINQIPPVGLTVTKIARPETIDFLEIREFELTTIMRQAESNPIISLSSSIINGKHGRFKTSLLEDGTGVEVIKLTNENGDDLQHLLDQYFVSKEFRDDSDYVKVIAWTNKMVNYMNDYIRFLIYGDDSKDKILLGERLIADKPIKEGKKILFNTNQEFEVSNFVIDTFRIGEDRDAVDLKYYSIDVEYFTDSGRLVSVPIMVLHEDSQDDYDDILKYLKDQAINYKHYNMERKKAWQNFYGFQEIFAQVKYNYAITAHKSQGSTYKNTFVMSSDISKNKNVDELGKILYTAVTRAKYKLYLLTN